MSKTGVGVEAPERPLVKLSGTRRVIAFGAYVAFLSLLVEIAARCAVSYTNAFVYNFAIGNDAQWRLAWFKRHEQTGVAIFYRFDVHDARRGWAVAPNLKNARVVSGKTLNTNSRGVRGAVEHSYDRNAATPRVVVLGDSFTFGDELDDGETYPAQLQTRLPDAEILNLGVHGYGHDQMLIYLQDEGVKYRPDIVLLGFAAIDAYRNVLAFRDYAKPQYRLQSDGALRLTNVPIPPPEALLRSRWRRIQAIDVASALAGRLAKRPSIGDVQRITGALLREIARSTRTTGAIPLWVYLPTSGGGQIHPNEIESLEMESDWEKWLLERCDIERVSCLSLRPAFLAARARGVPMKTSGHWSPEQNRIAADAIAWVLSERPHPTRSAPPDTRQ